MAQVGDTNVPCETGANSFKMNFSDAGPLRAVPGPCGGKRLCPSSGMQEPRDLHLPGPYSRWWPSLLTRRLRVSASHKGGLAPTC